MPHTNLRARIAGSLAAVLLAATVTAAQTPSNQTPAAPAQAPVQRPLNPTQEVAGEQPEGPSIPVGPAQLRIGGYLGVTGFYRSTNDGGGIGTNFGSIPYADTRQGNLSESRLSAQGSRITLRVDADFPADEVGKPEERPRFRKLAGYFEMDFNGSTPNTIAVTSTSAGFRLRHAFAEVQYRDSFFMGVGQAFSLMTPQKHQISMWPSDVEMSQAIDTNYLAGMVWGRIPQFRLTWRPSTQFNWAFSLENPEQQLGNSLVTYPACCSDDLEAQYNEGSAQLSVPNLLPDLQTRVAFNTSQLHVDAGGVLRVFRHKIAPYQSGDDFRTVGGGANLNGSVRLTPTFKMLGQFAFGPGIGRYIGGLVPDVTFNADSSIDPLDTTSWVGGVEWALGSRASIAGYYSGSDTDKQSATDTDGTFIGFGFPGSSNANNKTIQELTLTASLLSFRSPNRGSAQINLQYSWLERKPWESGAGPSSASMHLFFVQVRYNLP
jgi:hypothetical protein